MNKGEKMRYSKLPFKIKSVFLVKDRLNELEEIPKLLSGYIDYWKAAELLCEKDGGRLPTMKELAQLASYIYGKDIAPYKDYVNLEIKNMPAELKPIYEKQGWFALWSRREYSATSAYYRHFNTSRTFYYYYRHGISNFHGVCLGE
jgi:hypothetical protein